MGAILNIVRYRGPSSIPIRRTGLHFFDMNLSFPQWREESEIESRSMFLFLLSEWINFNSDMLPQNVCIRKTATKCMYSHWHLELVLDDWTLFLQGWKPNNSCSTSLARTSQLSSAKNFPAQLNSTQLNSTQQGSTQQGSVELSTLLSFVEHNQH